jgi:hypothetical protein
VENVLIHVHTDLKLFDPFLQEGRIETTLFFLSEKGFQNRPGHNLLL